MAPYGRRVLPLFDTVTIVCYILYSVVPTRTAGGSVCALLTVQLQCENVFHAGTEEVTHRSWREEGWAWSRLGTWREQGEERRIDKTRASVDARSNSHSPKEVFEPTTKKGERAFHSSCSQATSLFWNSDARFWFDRYSIDLSLLCSLFCVRSTLCKTRRGIQSFTRAAVCMTHVLRT